MSGLGLHFIWSWTPYYVASTWRTYNRLPSPMPWTKETNPTALTTPSRASLIPLPRIAAATASLFYLSNLAAAMEPDTRTNTSFEKDVSKTKETTPKSKNRSSSLLMISSGFTFLAALPQRSTTSSSFRSSSFR
ncbi:hypothetical protein CEP54_009191 [Fusarium duplospermum]|uniref:Uncharacterized protein n=1 Tax=Fusarium duplospermum TaxID=1325734 RepID=A0A428PRQ0_9HYPO|nr:hypothetical protein CEP54_009191 [Fusarium duplospermum]